MSAKTVIVRENVLAENMKKAEAIRKRLNSYNVHMINLMSSPGSGKTSLILESIGRLKDKYLIAVIEGDVASSIDSERISRQNIRAIQINTAGGCHLDASMIDKALDALDLNDLDLIFIENVGNLVCTADFDLGAHKNVVILSIPEGDDKPYKYPIMFAESDMVLVNKTDVLPYFDFNLDDFPGIIEGLNPSARVLPVSAKTGDGMHAWVAWIVEMLQ